MVIPERYRRCVVFLEQDRTDRPTQTMRRRTAATAFVVSTSNDPDTKVFGVTAAHVIRECSEAAAQMRGGASVFLRNMNQNRTSNASEISLNNWKFHSSCDIAVTELSAEHTKALPDWFTLADVATGEYVRTQGIGIGDDVFFIGFFDELPGKARIQPVVRFGKISLMPHEEINVDLGLLVPQPAKVYVIEATSWPGFSGSPVMACLSANRRLEPNDNQPRLVGILHGAVQTKDPNKPQHTGFAIVTPAQSLIDLVTS
jgi:Trypsin-like peptidase domain